MRDAAQTSGVFVIRRPISRQRLISEDGPKIEKALDYLVDADGSASRDEQ